MFSKAVVEKFNSIPTPFYYYDMEVLKRTLDSIKKESEKYGYIVHYALKANTNDPILKQIAKHGLGADCVSGNEVKKAIEVGFKSSHVAFAGVGKSDEEINIGLKHDIFCFNCESPQELEVINELAVKQNKKARVALRINPNVNAHTHHYITTGLEENKFGINMSDMPAVIELIKKLNNIELIGIHFHVGSQITNLDVFKNLCLRVNEIIEWFYHHKIKLTEINVGGGLGVDYHHPDEHMVVDFETYFGLFNTYLKLEPHQRLHFEIGRAIVAQCGNLISRVLYIKKGTNTNFAILDAGMTELIRPALYQSYHLIQNLTANYIENKKEATTKYDVVGPICESSDCFIKALMLPETKRGDIMVLRTAGAYGEVMASRYNLREKVNAIYSE